MEYSADKYAILSDFHKLILNCLILLILFTYFFFFENFTWKNNIFIYSIKILVSGDDDKFINTLIEENIIEAVTSVFDEKEDKNTIVYLKKIFFYHYFNILH